MKSFGCFLLLCSFLSLGDSRPNIGEYREYLILWDFYFGGGGAVEGGGYQYYIVQYSIL